ncbi:MAG: secretin and TonB N-terminal domain-containing protein [Burkholderiales bacterium]
MPTLFNPYLKKFYQCHASLTMRRLLMLLICAGVTGCAGTQAFREGNTLLAEGKLEQGLAKLEEAVKLAPENAEYRIALATRRASIINRYVATGDAARREGRLPDAENAYRQALNLDPANSMAMQGQDALVKEHKHRVLITEAEAILKKGNVNELNQALDKVRIILTENPSNKDAISLKQRIENARANTPKSEAKLSANFRKPITLEFRDAPLKTVLEMIAKVSGMNFFYDKDIRADAKATVFVKNTNIEDALHLVLATNQLELKILNDNSVLIFPSTPAKLRDYQSLSVRTFYLNNADVKAVSNTIKTLVKTKDLVIDERLGIIFMRDTPEAIRMAERIVALQDISDPEVMLEVEVMEIKRARLLDLGIQWPSQFTLTPLKAGGGTALTIADLQNLNRNTIGASVGSVTINARKENQDVNILANPRIRVRNKEKAKIQIGDRVPVITTTSTATGFVGESVSYVDVGLKLEVEPNIYLDEEVSIKVNLEVSNLVREILTANGGLSYQIGTRGANTVLRLRDGETQILAGLISDEERSTASRIPVLGELPIASRLFGTQKDDAQRSEILLSITPRVLRSIRRPDLSAAEFDSGTESNIGSQALRLRATDPAGSDATRVPPAGNIPRQPPGRNVAPTPQPGNIPPPPAQPGSDIAPTPQPGTIPPPPTQSGRDIVPTPVDPQTTNPTDATPAVQSASGTNAGSITFGWNAPAQVKVGEEFNAVLRINASQSVKGLPTLIKFDPQALQVLGVKEGEFFKQGDSQSNFNPRVEPAQGQILISAGLQDVLPQSAGVNGSGSLATFTFKALRSSIPTAIQLLSASPEPLPSTPLALPVEQLIRIVP